jgi:hypothetical protein
MDIVYVGAKPRGAAIFAALDEAGIGGHVLVPLGIDQLILQLSAGKRPVLVILCERDADGQHVIPRLPEIRAALPDAMLVMVIPRNEAVHFQEVPGPFTLIAPEHVDTDYIVHLIRERLVAA